MTGVDHELCTSEQLMDISSIQQGGENNSNHNNKRQRTHSAEIVTNPDDNFISDGDAILLASADLVKVSASLSADQKPNIDRIIKLLEKAATSVFRNQAYFACKIAHLEQKSTARFTPNNEETGASYANAVKNAKPKPKARSIYIKSTNTTSGFELLEQIKTNLDPIAEKIPISNTAVIKNNLVKITTTSEDFACKLAGRIKEHVADIQVEEERKFQPRIILFKIPCQLTDENLLNQIYDNNAPINENMQLNEFKKNIKIIRRTKPVENHHLNIIIEVTAAVRQLLQLNAKGKLFIAWETVDWKDHFFTMRCFKCLGTGHSHKECRNTEKCAKCGENHPTKECGNHGADAEHCHLCKSNHNATDEEAKHKLGSKLCKAEKHAVNKLKYKVNYDYSQ